MLSIQRTGAHTRAVSVQDKQDPQQSETQKAIEGIIKSLKGLGYQELKDDTVLHIRRGGAYEPVTWKEIKAAFKPGNKDPDAARLAQEASKELRLLMVGGKYWAIHEYDLRRANHSPTLGKKSGYTVAIPEGKDYPDGRNMRIDAKEAQVSPGMAALILHDQLKPAPGLAAPEAKTLRERLAAIKEALQKEGVAADEVTPGLYHLYHRNSDATNAWFKKWDKKPDGKITREEAQAFVKAADTNGDGKLSDLELAPLRTGDGAVETGALESMIRLAQVNGVKGIQFRRDE